MYKIPEFQTLRVKNAQVEVDAVYFKFEKNSKFFKKIFFIKMHHSHIWSHMSNPEAMLNVDDVILQSCA